MNQRPWLLVLSCICMVAGGVIAWRLGWPAAAQSIAVGVCLRLSIVLAAIWLAYPLLIEMRGRLPITLMVGMILAAAIVVIRPQLLVFAVIFSLLLVIVHFGLKWVARQASGGPTDQRRRRD